MDLAKGRDADQKTTLPSLRSTEITDDGGGGTHVVLVYSKCVPKFSFDSWIGFCRAMGKAQTPTARMWSLPRVSGLAWFREMDCALPMARGAAVVWFGEKV
ncbi:unnamed protein product [Cercospora beticola]|nr:unnamed protein product [Cercospora beticola]